MGVMWGVKRRGWWWVTLCDAALTPFNTLLLRFQAGQVRVAAATARLAPLCFGQRSQNG